MVLFYRRVTECVEKKFKVRKLTRKSLIRWLNGESVRKQDKARKALTQGRNRLPGHETG